MADAAPTPTQDTLGTVKSRLELVLEDQDLDAEVALMLRTAVSDLDEAKAEIKKLNRIATDRMYMMTAYRQMLGPKGCEVADMWDAKGVTRQHTSWGTEAAAMTGEERAQVHLDIEAMPKTRRHNLDSGGDTLRDSLAQCADDLRKRPAELRGPYGVTPPSTESN